MRLTRKSVAAAALIATAAFGAAIAIAPSYAQDGVTVAETTPLEARMRAAGVRAGQQQMFAHIARAEAMIEKFDTDGDGIVTQDEIDAARAAELAEYDADGDGNLTLEEYQAYWLDRFYERMVDAFQVLDADGDGEITDAEFNAGFANIVARLDQNGDGGLGEDDRPDVPLVGPGGPRR